MCVADVWRIVEPGEVVELNRLRGEGEGPGDERLGGDDGGAGGEDRERHDPPVGRHVVEGTAHLDTPLGEERCLSEVVEQEAGQHQPVPGDLYCSSPEVAHVGIERLAAGDDEEDGTESKECSPRMIDEEIDRVGRRHRTKHGWMNQDLAKPSAPSTVNQTTMIGLNTRGDSGGAANLDGEKPTRMTTETGITQAENAEVATSKPSTADNTEIAGVINPSP